MNGYLVIGIFTVILAITLYWLQGRESKIETPIIKKDPEKMIEIVKARDWVVEEEKEDSTSPESEPMSEDEEPSIEVEELIPVELEPEPVVEEVISRSKTVEDKDIALLSGVGPKYRSLLKEAGYTTVNQIASSEPQNLLDKLLEANERVSITKRPPTLSNVEKWIELAKTQLA